MEINIDITNVSTKPPEPKGVKRVLLQHKQEQDYVLQIDNTSLETFNTCARSAEYRLIDGRVPPATAALVYGAAIHEGLEYYYKHAEDQSDEHIRGMLDAATAAFDPDVPIPPNEWRTPDRCHNTLLRYIKHYEGEGLNLHIYNDAPAVEIPFSLPLGTMEFNDYVTHRCVEKLPEGQADNDGQVFVRNIFVYWTGKIDIMERLDGANWVTDHKTTSMLGPTFWKQFELSNQTIGYTWAAEEIYGEPFAGLRANVIAGRKITRTGVPTQFERQKFFYRRDQVAEWKDNTMALVGDFIANLHRHYFPMTTAWCVGKYGTCKYHDVCTLPANQRNSMLHSDQYSTNTWSPLNK